MNQRLSKHTLLLLAALLFTSSLAAAIWFVRFVYTGSYTFIFLLWNLFLAWLPVLFAQLARRQRASRHARRFAGKIIGRGKRQSRRHFQRHAERRSRRENPLSRCR